MLSRYVAAAVLFLATTWTLQAQEAIPAAAARIKAPDGVTRIPFELANNRIYVEGQIDSRPARFLVDTGGINVLTPAAAQRLGLKVESNAAAGEGRADRGLARASEVRVRAATLAKPVFSIVDLGDLERIEGVPFDGVLGYEMFRHFGVQIDYRDRVLILTESDRFAAPAGATMIPFELQERTPIVSARLDGMTVRLAIDTAARDTLTLHSPFVRENDLIARYRAAPESVTGWSAEGASRGRPARLGALELGNRRIDRIAGTLFVGDKGEFASPSVSATLGGGALRRFTVVFNFSGRRMYLLPNTDFGKPDSFDRSGLWLMADPGADQGTEHGALQVMDVAAESAAARADLRVGDRIVAIGGESIAKRSLADWRAELREQPAGTKLPIKYERAGQPAETVLQLADRIPAR